MSSAEPSPSERVLRAVFSLAMLGSVDSTTDVVIDADEVAQMSGGVPRAVVDEELAALVAAGGADAL